jgi:hypothetical protein
LGLLAQLQLQQCSSKPQGCAILCNVELQGWEQQVLQPIDQRRVESAWLWLKAASRTQQLQYSCLGRLVAGLHKLLVECLTRCLHTQGCILLR